MTTKSLIIFVLFIFITASSCREHKPAQQAVRDTEFREVKAVDSAQQQSSSLPSFTVFDVNGNIINLTSLKGKKVFINLWATWCSPCREEIPSIEKLAKLVDTSKVSFVMISLDDNFESAKRFAKSRKLSLPVFYPAEGLPQLFKVDAIPSTFIFDKSGMMIKSIEGSEDYSTADYRNMLQ